MDSRKKDGSPIWTLIEGTAIGVFGRWFLAPVEEIYLKKADPRYCSTYGQLARETFTLPNLYRLNSIFFTSMLGQTALKSFSTMGIIHCVNTQFPHYSPEKRTLLITALGVPAETLTTSYGEWEKTLDMRKIKHPKLSLLSTSFLNALAATGVRVGITSITTYYAILKTIDLAQHQFPKVSATERTAGAAGLAAAAVQFINMPVINFQNWAFTHSERPSKKIVTSFFQQPPAKFFQGVLGRAGYRSAFYFSTFWASSKVSEYKKNRKEAQEVCGSFAKPTHKK